MAGNLGRVAELLRQIAGGDEIIRRIEEAVKSRGPLAGVSVLADIAADQDECCTRGQNDPPEDPWKPPEEPNDPNKDDPWNDCTTGQPVEFFPSGFPQPETCKDCEPPTCWEQGICWTASSPGCLSSPEAWGNYLQDNLIEQYEGSILNNYEPIGIKFTEFSGDGCPARVCAYGILTEPSGAREIQSCTNLGRRACVSGDDECPETEPESCGDNWAPDGATDYTLSNGCIVGSRCDPDAGSGDLGCNECKNLCRGDELWTICATSDGGFVAYDPSGEKPGVKYGSDGRTQDTIPAGDGRGTY